MYLFDSFCILNTVYPPSFQYGYLRHSWKIKIVLGYNSVWFRVDGKGKENTANISLYSVICLLNILLLDLLLHFFLFCNENVRLYYKWMCGLGLLLCTIQIIDLFLISQMIHNLWKTFLKPQKDHTPKSWAIEREDGYLKTGI